MTIDKRLTALESIPSPASAPVYTDEELAGMAKFLIALGAMSDNPHERNPEETFVVMPCGECWYMPTGKSFNTPSDVLRKYPAAQQIDIPEEHYQTALEIEAIFRAKKNAND